MVKKIASLDLGAFHSLDKDKRQAYLGIVDQLRELGVGEDLSLPQVHNTRRNLFTRIEADSSSLWLLVINPVESRRCSRA